MTSRRVLDALTLLVACAVLQTIRNAKSAETEHRIACPVDIPKESLVAPKAPTGWTATIRDRVLLHAVDISFGPPEEQAFLKPEDAPEKRRAVRIDSRL